MIVFNILAVLLVLYLLTKILDWLGDGWRLYFAVFRAVKFNGKRHFVVERRRTAKGWEYREIRPMTQDESDDNAW